MIQVYSSGSTVIMHMHYIWPVLHMTSCLVAINKNRDMCFDMKNGKKTYFSGEIPVNDCRNVWRGLKSIRLIKKIFLRISKVSCKESSRSQSLIECSTVSLKLLYFYTAIECVKCYTRDRESLTRSYNAISGIRQENNHHLLTYTLWC